MTKRMYAQRNIYIPTHTNYTVQMKAASKVNYWVTMTDSFMSGWGKAEGKTNKLVLECETFEEAQIVKHNAMNRSEMKYVNIAYTKPSYNKSRYEVSLHNKEDYSAWFKAGYFRGDRQ